jgi:hypothetical protein
MQTVLQQMLPFGIERLRRNDLGRSFPAHYDAVPGCNADRKRKDGAKNERSSPERMLRTSFPHSGSPGKASAACSLRRP